MNWFGGHSAAREAVRKERIGAPQQFSAAPILVDKRLLRGAHGVSSLRWCERRRLISICARELDHPVALFCMLFVYVWGCVIYLLELEDSFASNCF